MSINWPYKSEDLNEVISKLEQDLALKYVEITQNDNIINELLEKSKNVKIEVRNTNSKLEFTEKEINRLTEEFEKSKSTISYVRSEINQLDHEIMKNQLEIDELLSIKEKVEDKDTLKEIEIKKMSILKQNLLFNQLKKVLFHKGFITINEFEDLYKKI